MEDVVEYEHTVDGLVTTKLDRILLNGSHVCMLVPGSEGPEEGMRRDKAQQASPGNKS